ncbi:MAG: hypothetical protein CMK09_11120 [Ponticaulis sp.]|nr:hypothetical protein [Ponticaulis sp.]|tara:strand:+ start:60224 stop:62206 length:1983 start_codon:yes stop_codon:yes gene_type:complete
MTIAFLRVWLRSVCLMLAGVLTFTLSAGASPRAVEAITLPDASEYILLLAQHSEVLMTDAPGMALSDVRQAEGWEVSSSDTFDMRDGTKSYWIRFGVTNPKAETEHLVLDMRAAAHDYFRAFTIDADGTVAQLIETDRDSVFAARDIAATRLNAQVSLEPGETKELYLEVDPYFATRYHFVLASELTFRIFDQVNEDWSLFWYGGMITVFVLAMLALPLIGWRVTAAFLAMIGCAVITTMAAEGVLAQYLMSDLPVRWGWNVTDFFYYHTMTSLLAVGIFLFDLHKDRPRYAVWVMAVIGYISCLSLFSFWLNVYDSNLLLSFYRAVLPLAFLTHLTTGILSVRKKKPGATAFLLASIVPLVYAMNALLFGFSFEIPSPPIFELSEFRNLILLQLVVIAFAIVQRYARIRSERDRALQTELDITQEKLELSEELRESREKYDHIKRQSEQQREQLSAVSHDILQPLQSLRSGLKSLNLKDEDAIQNMHDAFDYLESLARSSMHSPQGEPARSSPSGFEAFALRAVTDVAYAMFKDDAGASGVRLRYEPCELMVHSEPVTLMRILNNALANALKHAKASQIDLRSERSDQSIALIISDDGQGMSEAQLTRAQEKHSRGEASDGQGLGLNLMAEECERLGLGFEIESQPGKGTVITIRFPMR